MSYKIPLKVLQSHIAILGKTGSGKTITAKGAVETLLEAGERVCAIDPTGVWWGLKSSANGKKAAYPVVIFGGEHADFPISRTSGAAIAEIVGTTNISSVIDTRLMGVAERTQFFTDFAENLLRRNKGPLHLVIDEAHLFAPQGRVNDPQSGKMVNAANQLVSLGRGLGLRIMLLSQRPAKLHKDSLTQAETLIAMRVIAPQDRQAIKAWIGEMADIGTGDDGDVMKSLPKLATGSGWIWSPENDILEMVKFPMIKTFDTSKAPTGEGEKVVLAEIDEAKINKLLGEAGKGIMADDPKRLKIKIAELEKANESLIKSKSGYSAHAYEAGVKAARDEGYSAGFVHGKNEGKQEVLFALDEFVKKGVKVVRHPVDHSGDKPQIRIDIKPEPVVSQISGKLTIKSDSVSHEAEKSLPEGEKKILIAIAQNPSGCTREQISILTGYKKSSRDAYIQRLSAKGYVDKLSDGVIATRAGVDALGSDYETLPTGAALREYWLERLPDGEAKVLKSVLGFYPEACPRDVISANTDYKKSSRDAYIQRLRARQLVAVSSDGVTASSTLY